MWRSFREIFQLNLNFSYKEQYVALVLAVVTSLLILTQIITEIKNINAYFWFLLITYLFWYFHATKSCISQSKKRFIKKFYLSKLIRNLHFSPCRNRSSFCTDNFKAKTMPTYVKTITFTPLFSCKTAKYSLEWKGIPVFLRHSDLKQTVYTKRKIKWKHFPFWTFSLVYCSKSNEKLRPKTNKWVFKVRDTYSCSRGISIIDIQAKHRIHILSSTPV